MRILFVGAVEFSKHCLKEVLKNGGNVIAIITLDEKYARFNSDYIDLSDVAQEHNIPIYKIDKINKPTNVELIKSLKPDIIFVFGFSQIISKEILDVPPMGCIGTHPTLLPKNRGRHPLIWALVYGLKKSGLTFFYIDEGADSGDILAQKEFEITLEDDASTLYEKMKQLASEIIAENLPLLEDGTAKRIPQDHSKANYWRKRGEKDGEINWTKPTMEIYNLVRALTHPYVGAHTYLNQQKMIVWKARLPEVSKVFELDNFQNGEVFFIDDDDRYYVKTGDGYINVLDYEVLDSERILKIGDLLGGQV